MLKLAFPWHGMAGSDGSYQVSRGNFRRLQCTSLFNYAALAGRRSVVTGASVGEGRRVDLKLKPVCLQAVAVLVFSDSVLSASYDTRRGEWPGDTVWPACLPLDSLSGDGRAATKGRVWIDYPLPGYIEPLNTIQSGRMWRARRVLLLSYTREKAALCLARSPPIMG